MLDRKNDDLLVDENFAWKQLNSLNVREDSVEDFLIHNKGILDILADKFIECVDTHREDILIRCGNRLWQPDTRKKSASSIKFAIKQDQIDKICKGDPASIIHFHGVYLGYPSDADKITHQEVFKEGFRDGAILGCDGIHIQTSSGNYIRIPWSNVMYNRLAESGKNILTDVKAVTCNKNDKNSKFRECNIHLLNGKKVVNMFSEFIWEEPVINETLYQYHILDSKSKDRTNYVEFQDRVTNCIITENKKDRILSCFHRDIPFFKS